MPLRLETFTLPGQPAWRQTMRMTLAAMLAYFATGLVGLHHGYWAVITCLVIMQGSLGATISAGLARIAGTAAGAGVGGIGALLLLVHGIPQWLVLLLVTAPLCLLASSRAIFRLAPLTGALVLLLAGTGSLGFALARVAEIGLGTVIGVLASLMVLPERATAILVAHAASILESLGAHAAGLLSHEDALAHESTAAKLRSLFAQLQNDLKEVAQERSAHLLRHDPFADDLCRHLQRLRTDVNMLGRAAALNGAEPHAELAERIRASFLSYASALRQPARLPDEQQLVERVPAEASNMPLGFALLTLQAEFKALHETLKRWQTPASP
jgi:uncharacterized membrane protein YccC